MGLPNEQSIPIMTNFVIETMDTLGEVSIG